MHVESNTIVFYINNIYYDKLRSIPTKYILDSNIIADLEYFYYKPENHNDTKKQNISELVNFLRGKSIDYTYALTELCLNYEKGGVNEEKYKSTKQAVSKIIKMSPSKLRGHANYGKNKDTIPFYGKQLSFGLPSEVIPKTLPVLAYSYVPLLKLFYEIKTNSHNKLQIMKNFIDYLDNEINALPLYEVCFATYLFFTNDNEFNNVQSLLKVNNKMDVIKKIWNVSWDITFLRYINSLAARIVSGEDISPKANFVLITQDKALGQISSLLQTDSENKFGNKAVSNITIDIQKIKSQYRTSYQEIYNCAMNSEAFARRKSLLATSDPNEQINKMLNKADNLQALLIQS